MSSRSKKQLSAFTFRHMLIACLFVAWMGVIIWRLAQLQITRHEELAQKAARQRNEQLSVKPSRGDIVDRNGALLAGSIDTESVMADLYQVEEKAKPLIIKTLAPFLRTSEEDLERRLGSRNKAPILGAKLDYEVSNNIRNAVADNKFTGIKIIRNSQRYYPNSFLASHVLGYMNAAGEGVAGLELRRDQKLIGLDGNPVDLDGQDGSLSLEKDARGAPFARAENEAITGARIISTIDIGLQHKVEMALAQAVEETHSLSGSVIVSDPATGEILAMTNYPTFDPGARWGNQEHENFTRRNRAVMDTYEPGSVFKMVTYAAAVEEGLVRPEDKVHCGNGQITLGSRVIHDAHPYGELTIAQAFAKSSNVAAIKTAMKVGKEKFYGYITRFGFGKKTRIDLPAEAAGVVNPLSSWQSTSIASIAMGHEVGVTAIQAVAAMAAIANGGLWVQPHVIKRVVSGDSNQHEIWKPNPETRRVISEQTANTIRQLLTGVVESGTARNAVRLEGYTAAGKTGTSQKIVNRTYSKTAYIASFAGFVPAVNPRFAIIVVLDYPKGPHQGGAVAAPVFNQVAEAALSDYGVLPDSEVYRQKMAELQSKYQSRPAKASSEETLVMQKVEQAPTPKPVARPTATPAPTRQPAVARPTPVAKAPTTKNAVVAKSKAEVAKSAPGTVPNMTGRSLREVASLCNQAGLKLKAIGSGTARSQRRVGDTLIVEFR